MTTGQYDYTLTLTAWISGNSYARAYSGSQAVVNRTTSEYGGWWLDGLDRLVASSAGGLLVQGNGDTLWFASDGAGGYLKAAGDPGYATLVKNGNNTFTLTDKFLNVRNYSTIGLLTSASDSNANSFSYTYTDADSDAVSDELSKITDPFGREINFTFTGGLLTGITDFASRTNTLAYSSTRLSTVTRVTRRRWARFRHRSIRIRTTNRPTS